MPRTPLLWNRLVKLVQKDIWQPAYLSERSFRGASYAVLRVVSITLTGLQETRATARAAALAFSSLLGIGPLIGIAVLIAGFAAGKNDPQLVVNKLNDLINFVAPQLNHYEDIKNSGAADAQAHADAVVAASPAVNPELVTHINDFINATRSSAGGGIVSAISLIIIVLMLFTSIEGVFNDIWGVRRGRSWVLRIVFYWTILTLGAVLFFGALGALSAATFIRFFKDHLGEHVASLLNLSLPVLSLSLLIGILTLFYRYIPNTRVFWRAALTGAIVVTLLIYANNLLAAAYFSRVELTRNLYGSLALPMILMFGLYIFWLVVLVGGQISYAVQNVHYRNSQAAWDNLSASTRERLTLIVLLTIGRRFQSCLPPCNVAQLGSTIKVPTQILNEALNRLVDLHLVTPVPSAEENTASDYAYQPARPLNSITLGEFKETFDSHGDDPAGDSIDRLDPLIEQYHATIRALSDHTLFSKPLDALFEEHDFDESRPPFTLGQNAQKTT
ncbi:MAG: YihY/virulence factor BrkB family protein [Nibricoccus sp.]